jgi:hypothetical protein
MDHNKNKDVEKQLRKTKQLDSACRQTAKKRTAGRVKRGCNIHGSADQWETSAREMTARMRPEPVSKWPNFGTATLMEAADG